MFGLSSLYLKIGAGLLALSALLAAGFYGYTKGSQKSAIAIANYQATAATQVNTIKDKVATVNDKVTVKYVDRVKTVTQQEIVYRDIIVKQTPQFNLSKGWVTVHDAAATQTTPDSKLATDATPSITTDTAALNVVASNYAVCTRNAEKLKGLQNWVTDAQAATQSTNKKGAK